MLFSCPPGLGGMEESIGGVGLVFGQVDEGEAILAGPSLQEDAMDGPRGPPRRWGGSWAPQGLLETGPEVGLARDHQCHLGAVLQELAQLPQDILARNAFWPGFLPVAVPQKQGGKRFSLQSVAEGLEKGDPTRGVGHLGDVDPLETLGEMQVGLRLVEGFLDGPHQGPT